MRATANRKPSVKIRCGGSIPPLSAVGARGFPSNVKQPTKKCLEIARYEKFHWWRT